jgi:NAD(P)-dependent dehydrogenase (short-subunit alcohol dehydrogenase family)
MDETNPAHLPLDLFRLDGQVVLVTGASSGLGERFARVLHAVGATVVVSARRLDRLEALVAELPGAVAIAADVGVPEDRVRLVGDTVGRLGRLDVLVNNAGIAYVSAIENETLEQFEQVMNVNATAVWHLSKLAVPHMIEGGGGSIVNVASMLGHVASTPVKQSNYCASKGAVVNLTRELAVQLARKGVRVNALCPGYFPSEMTEPMIGDADSENYLATYSPMPRMGRDDELDGALLLLATRAGSYITGHSLLVDGGFTAR